MVEEKNNNKKSIISGSSVCILVMYIGWIWYIVVEALCYWKLDTFLPPEITYGTAALFLVETVSLVRLKMAKEGLPIKNKIANPILKKIGVDSLPDFEEEVQEQVKINEELNNNTLSNMQEEVVTSSKNEIEEPIFVDAKNESTSEGIKE